MPLVLGSVGGGKRIKNKTHLLVGHMSRSLELNNYVSMFYTPVFWQHWSSRRFISDHGEGGDVSGAG